MAGDDFTSAVVTVLRSLKVGEVVTYGDVAAEAGHPGAARAVGNVLRTVPDLPWWRVVAADGRLVPGHEPQHAALLRGEGVMVRKGRVARRRPGEDASAELLLSEEEATEGPRS